MENGPKVVLRSIVFRITSQGWQVIAAANFAKLMD